MWTYEIQTDEIALEWDGTEQTRIQRSSPNVVRNAIGVPIQPSLYDTCWAVALAKHRDGQTSTAILMALAAGCNQFTERRP